MILKSSRKEESFSDSVFGSVGRKLEKGFEELVGALIGLMLAVWV